MSYIEKEKLIKADIVSIENRVRHAFNQGYDLGFKDGKKAKPQDIDYKAQYERLSQKAEIVISQLRADRDRLMSLPSVTPIRPKGHWIDHSDDGYVECPKCGSATNCDGNIADLHFCFSCGAELEEVEDGKCK